MGPVIDSDSRPSIPLRPVASFPIPRPPPPPLLRSIHRLTPPLLHSPAQPHPSQLRRLSASGKESSAQPPSIAGPHRMEDEAPRKNGGEEAWNAPAAMSSRLGAAAMAVKATLDQAGSEEPVMLQLQIRVVPRCHAGAAPSFPSLYLHSPRADSRPSACAPSRYTLIYCSRLVQSCTLAWKHCYAIVLINIQVPDSTYFFRSGIFWTYLL